MSKHNELNGTLPMLSCKLQRHRAMLYSDHIDTRCEKTAFDGAVVACDGLSPKVLLYVCISSMNRRINQSSQKVKR